MPPSLVVLTGAGISADSGLATFRGAGGLWEGMRVEDVATPEAWARDPHKVWRFYQMRRTALATVEPNPAHLALAELESELTDLGIPFHLVTQNVDNLHERAGSRAIHMHGELTSLRCEACHGTLHDEEHVDAERFLPCPDCGHERLRPDIVWFGEIPYHMDRIEAALSTCTYFAAIGTSGCVYPAAGFLALARSLGARTFVNSLDPPENLHPSDELFQGKAKDVVPELVREWVRELARPGT